MVARRPRRLARGDKLDVVHVDGIEVRGMQPCKAPRDARADALRGIVERVPRVPKPTAFRELRVTWWRRVSLERAFGTARRTI